MNKPGLLHRSSPSLSHWPRRKSGFLTHAASSVSLRLGHCPLETFPLLLLAEGQGSHSSLERSSLKQADPTLPTCKVFQQWGSLTHALHPSSPRGQMERGWGKLVVAMSRVVQGASGGRFRTLNVLGIGDSQEQHSKLQSGEIQWVIPAKLKNTLLYSTVKSMYYLNYQLLNSTNT